MTWLLLEGDRAYVDEGTKISGDGKEKGGQPMPTLLFVYNADSGLFNTLTDIAHKIFSPGTYACNLCALTHSPLGMRAEWKSFLAELGRPLEFLHRDEFRQRYGMVDVALPAVFGKGDNNTVELRLDAATINAASTLDELKSAIQAKLELA